MEINLQIKRLSISEAKQLIRIHTANQRRVKLIFSPNQ